MTDETRPPLDAYSAFKAFLEKLVKVPKSEIDRKQAEYIESRKHAVKPGPRKKAG